jgi:hypothetical protein
MVRFTGACGDDNGSIKAEHFHTASNMQPSGRYISKHGYFLGIGHRLEALQTQHYWICFPHLV